MANDEKKPPDKSSVRWMYAVSIACIIAGISFFRDAQVAWRTHTMVVMQNKEYYPIEGVGIGVLLVAVGVIGLWPVKPKAK